MSFIQILSRFYPNFLLVLSRFYPNLILILSRFFRNSLYQDFILILSRFYPDFLETHFIHILSCFYPDLIWIKGHGRALILWLLWSLTSLWLPNYFLGSSFFADIPKILNTTLTTNYIDCLRTKNISFRTWTTSVSNSSKSLQRSPR